MKNKNFYREIRKSFCSVKKGNQRLFAKVLKNFDKTFQKGIKDCSDNGYNSRFYLEPIHLIGWIEHCQLHFRLAQNSVYKNADGEEYRPIPLTADFWDDVPKSVVYQYEKLCRRIA